MASMTRDQRDRYDYLSTKRSTELSNEERGERSRLHKLTPQGQEYSRQRALAGQYWGGMSSGIDFAEKLYARSSGRED